MAYPLIALIAVFVAGVAIGHLTVPKTPSISEATVALSFANGYIYGQRAMIRAGGLTISLPIPTSPEFKDIAIAHGFTEAARYE